MANPDEKQQSSLSKLRKYLYNLFYSWTLNRHEEGHSQVQQTRMDAKITQFCMDPADFKEMKRSWPCAAFG